LPSREVAIETIPAPFILPRWRSRRPRNRFDWKFLFQLEICYNRNFWSVHAFMRLKRESAHASTQ
jgi:hypothetical protein